LLTVTNLIQVYHSNSPVDGIVVNVFGLFSKGLHLFTIELVSEFLLPGNLYISYMEWYMINLWWIWAVTGVYLAYRIYLSVAH